MAVTNRDRVGRALDLLKDGLGPWVELEIRRAVDSGRASKGFERTGVDRPLVERPVGEWDVTALVSLILDNWNNVFRYGLNQTERSHLFELRKVRNAWAHQETFSSDDAYRALDTAARLLRAVSASEADALDATKHELLRTQYEQQRRDARKKQARLPIGEAVGALKPWREVATPHRDVISGSLEQAEFAADLWQVHRGEASSEYNDPVEFFRRTYLTEGLQSLLTNAARRLTGKGGDPVVQLQTNFGGGKTHSMLALYHLCSDRVPADLSGVGGLMAKAEVERLPEVRRVVLVGNRISPGKPSDKEDGTAVRTLWGELAWQLGGAEAYARVAEDDARATSPGDALRELLVAYGPCLILIDEWVAYARQLDEQRDLPAGSFDTQFTFAQALTETVKAAGNSLLVVSLPASEDRGSPHAEVDLVEVGGQRGRLALDRLRNVVGRVDSSWRAASAEEGFEIVRRRLFEDFAVDETFRHRDAAALAYAEFYRVNQSEFPAECREKAYEERIKAAYPIHPEVFDRLYNDWSTLATFQRTRGVLRLMAKVIQVLWQGGDESPLIQPANLPVEDTAVGSELKRYLPENWSAVIDSDVDGPNSLPQRIDAEISNLGRLQACRRVARTVYLGSAPRKGAAHSGLEDRRIKLGCARPGEQHAVFGDALRRLAEQATYFYQDGTRYWYDTRPTVLRLARERKEQIARNEDRVRQEIRALLLAACRDRAGFQRVHVLPQSGHEVPDERETRLVVLGPEHCHHKDGSPAEAAARSLLESRGKAPRIYRNSLVFLAPDQSRLQALQEAVCLRLAWESIEEDREELELALHQVRQARTQCESAKASVEARLPEAYQWLLAPRQAEPTAEVEWEAVVLRSQAGLAERVAKRLRGEGQLLDSALAGTALRLELDRVWWRPSEDGTPGRFHVAVAELVEDFAKYLYLPRLSEPALLVGAVSDGAGLLSWEVETFAYADSWDEQQGRYRGLRCGERVNLGSPDAPGLLVHPRAAREQLDREAPEPPSPVTDPPQGADSPDTDTPDPDSPPPGPRLKRFYGTVQLSADRAGRDASRIADEVVSHLAGLVGAEVTVTLDIQARIPNGAPEHVVRAVSENSRTLNFDVHSFEEE